MEEQGLTLPARTKKHEHHTDPWRDPSADLQRSLCSLPLSFRHFHFLHSERPLWSLYNEVTQTALARQQTGLLSRCCSCCLPACVSARYLMQCLHSGSLCDEIKWGRALLIIPPFISTAEYLAHALFVTVFFPYASDVPFAFRKQLANCGSLPTRWTSILEEPLVFGSLF